jgi:hypothetical protein
MPAKKRKQVPTRPSNRKVESQKAIMNDPEINNQLVIPYLTLRRTVGILGIALPFVLILGGWIVFKTSLQGSLSAYYHTGMRDVFVGIL